MRNDDAIVLDGAGPGGHPWPDTHHRRSARPAPTHGVVQTVVSGFKTPTQISWAETDQAVCAPRRFVLEWLQPRRG